VRQEWLGTIPTTPRKRTVKQYGAEFLGAFWLVLGGCGSAVLAAAFPDVGIGLLGATDKRAPAGFAPIAIGLCLTLIHLISIPVTNTSLNPARSTGVWRCLSAAGRWRSCVP